MCNRVLLWLSRDLFCNAGRLLCPSLSRNASSSPLPSISNAVRDPHFSTVRSIVSRCELSLPHWQLKSRLAASSGCDQLESSLPRVSCVCAVVPVEQFFSLGIMRGSKVNVCAEKTRFAAAHSCRPVVRETILNQLRFHPFILPSLVRATRRKLSRRSCRAGYGLISFWYRGTDAAATVAASIATIVRAACYPRVGAWRGSRCLFSRCARHIETRTVGLASQPRQALHAVMASILSLFVILSLEVLSI